MAQESLNHPQERRILYLKTKNIIHIFERKAVFVYRVFLVRIIKKTTLLIFQVQLKRGITQTMKIKIPGFLLKLKIQVLKLVGMVLLI
jgi:hypothetical protein